MINYKILQDSVDHYSDEGYIRIESPWTVSEYVDNITKPEQLISYQLKHNDKCLVASGEQSFLYLYLKGFLPKGKFQTITPCFRHESFTDLHMKYFMKNELIQTDYTSEEYLEDMIFSALSFFREYLPEAKVIDTKIGKDIVWNNFELGSYGIRECEFLKWIYGTGCAEPRLSHLINKRNGLS